jgi:hypothetical protein
MKTNSPEEKEPREHPTAPSSQADVPGKPFSIRLPGFVRDEEIGLGDVVHRATSSLGIRPCSGCLRRAALLNRWLSFRG